MLQACRMGANVIGYVKDNKKYSMVCGWMTMIDYDRIIMLLGSQSETGNNLEVGMKAGVSALSTNQVKIAEALGFDHSSNDKINKVEHLIKDNMIIIPGSSCIMECTVLSISSVNESNDHLVTLSIDNYTNYNTDFLDGYCDELNH